MLRRTLSSGMCPMGSAANAISALLNTLFSNPQNVTSMLNSAKEDLAAIYINMYGGKKYLMYIMVNGFRTNWLLLKIKRNTRDNWIGEIRRL